MNVSADTVAIVILVVIVLLDKVLNSLKSRGIDLQLMSRQIDELWHWHNVEDSEGVKIWYVRRSLDDAILKLSHSIDVNTKLLDRIDRRLERLEGRIDNPP